MCVRESKRTYVYEFLSLSACALQVVEYHAWESYKGPIGGAIGVGVECMTLNSKVLVFACDCSVVTYNTDTILAVSGECGSLMVSSFRSELAQVSSTVCFRSMYNKLAG